MFRYTTYHGLILALMFSLGRYRDGSENANNSKTSDALCDECGEGRNVLTSSYTPTKCYSTCIQHQRDNEPLHRPTQTQKIEEKIRCVLE